MKTYGKFSSYSDLQNAVFTGAANWLEFGQCMRIYDKNGTHVLSLLPCQDSPRSKYDYDLCTPNGKVQACGVNECTVSSFVEFFGIEDCDRRSVDCCNAQHGVCRSNTAPW